MQELTRRGARLPPSVSFADLGAALLQRDPDSAELVLRDVVSLEGGERATAIALLAGRGRQLESFVFLARQLAAADTGEERQLSAALARFARRMRDDPTWVLALPGELGFQSPGTAETIGYFVAIAGGDVGRELLRHLLDARDGRMLTHVLLHYSAPLGDRFLQQVAALLAHRTSEPELRLAAVVALQRQGAVALPHLKTAYQALPPPVDAADEELRTLLQRALGNRGPETRLPTTVELRGPGEDVPAPLLPWAAIGLALGLLALGLSFKAQGLTATVLTLPVATLICFVTVASGVQRLATPVPEPVTETALVGLYAPELLQAAHTDLYRYLAALRQDLDEQSALSAVLRPPAFAAAKAAPGVRDGTAFLPFLRRFEGAPRLLLVPTGTATVRAVLLFGDDRALVAAVSYRLGEEGPRLRAFAVAEETDAAQVSTTYSAPSVGRSAPPPPRPVDATLLLALGLAVLGLLACTATVGRVTSLKPWLALRRPSKIRRRTRKAEVEQARPELTPQLAAALDLGTTGYSAHRELIQAIARSYLQLTVPNLDETPADLSSAAGPESLVAEVAPADGAIETELATALAKMFIRVRNRPGSTGFRIEQPGTKATMVPATHADPSEEVQDFLETTSLAMGALARELEAMRSRTSTITLDDLVPGVEPDLEPPTEAEQQT